VSRRVDALDELAQIGDALMVCVSAVHGTEDGDDLGPLESTLLDLAYRVRLATRALNEETAATQEGAIQ
jgi:hypothetical protein